MQSEKERMLSMVFFFAIPLWVIGLLVLILLGGANSFLIWLAENAFAIQTGGAVIIAIISFLIGFGKSIKSKLLLFSIGILFIEPSLIVAGDFALYYRTTSDFILEALLNVIIGFPLSLAFCLLIETIVCGLALYFLSEKPILFSLIILLGSFLTVYLYHLTFLSPV